MHLASKTAFKFIFLTKWRMAECLQVIAPILGGSERDLLKRKRNEISERSVFFPSYFLLLVFLANGSVFARVYSVP